MAGEATYLKVLTALLGSALLELGAKIKNFIEATLELEHKGAKESSSLVVNPLLGDLGELLLILLERHISFYL